MTDLHTHILPGIDDGASDFDTALEMLRAEIENHVDTVVLTPHYFVNEFGESDKEKIRLRFEELKAKCDGLPIRILLGAELYYHPYLAEQLKRHEALTMNGSDYILVEFSLVQKYYDLSDVFYNLQCYGYKVILAHPERYTYLTVEEIVELRRNGVLIQIDTSSVLGDFGKEAAKKAARLLRGDHVDFIASDAHSMGRRSPNLKKTLDHIEKKFKRKYDNRIDI